MEDEDQNWIDIGDYKYSQHEFFQFLPDCDFIKIYKKSFFNYFLTAIAPCGGPFAVLKDKRKSYVHIYKDKGKDDERLKDICIFKNNGELIAKYQPENIKCNVVGFQFIEDELLLVMYEDGKYFLYDPNGVESVRENNLSFQQEDIEILDCKVFYNGFGVLVHNNSNNKFIVNYVYDCYNPQIKRFNYQFDYQPRSWTIRDNIHGKIQLWANHSEKGIVLIDEDDDEQMNEDNTNIYFNRSIVNMNITSEKLPDIFNIILIGFNQEYVAFMTDTGYSDYNIYVFHNDLQPELVLKSQIKKMIDKSDRDQREKEPQKLLFISNKCVAVIYDDHLLLVQDEQDHYYQLNKRGFLILQEIDGIRIIDNKKNSILRQLTEEYLDIFDYLKLKNSPGQSLYDEYRAYQESKPLPDEDIKSKKDELKDAVEQCIEAATFELNPEKRNKLLKAALWGKSSLENYQQIDKNKCYEVSKYLRVVNQINNLLLTRTITYEQLRVLNEEVLLKIILRYRKHFLAYEVFKYLQFEQKYLQQICVNWACCVVEQEKGEEVLCEIIYKKLGSINNINFTEIANKAIDNGKPELATRLLQYEPNISKKVPILLYMEQYERALIESLNSQNSNLINMVIFKIVKSNYYMDDEEKLFKLMSNDEITKQHLKHYYINFEKLNPSEEQSQYFKYMQYLKSFEEYGMYLIKKAYSVQSMEERLCLLESAKKFIDKGSTKDNFNSQMLQTQIEYLKDQKQMGTFTELPIGKRLNYYFEKMNYNEADAFKKFYQIPDKRFYINKIQSLVKSNKSDQVLQIVMEKNKKTEMIPYEIVAQMWFDVDRKDLAEEYLCKMTSNVDNMLIYLKQIGSVRVAVEMAIKYKKYEYLEMWYDEIQDPQIKQCIETHLDQFKR